MIICTQFNQIENENLASHTPMVIISPTSCHCLFTIVSREQMVNDDLHDVFYLDSLPSSHPVSTVIDNPTYQDNFDRISYGKGSMLIRMMEDFLTSEVFFNALNRYFKVQYSVFQGKTLAFKVKHWHSRYNTGISRYNTGISRYNTDVSRYNTGIF